MNSFLIFFIFVIFCLCFIWYLTVRQLNKGHIPSYLTGGVQHYPSGVSPLISEAIVNSDFNIIDAINTIGDNELSHEMFNELVIWYNNTSDAAHRENIIKVLKDFPLAVRVRSINEISRSSDSMLKELSLKLKSE